MSGSAVGRVAQGYPAFIGLYSGNGTISSASNSITMREGVPTPLRVIIREQSSRREVGSVVSASDGTWSFGGLATNRVFRAEIEDFTDALNAAVSDWLKPV